MSHTEMSKSRPLRDAIKTKFYPFAEDCGFVRAKASSMSVLFFRHRQENVQWFEIQWDKYHRPSFIINFGEISEQSLHELTDDPIARPPSEYDLPIAGRLRRSDGEREQWFSTRKPLLKAAATLSPSFSPDEVADQLVLKFAEVDVWWGTKSAGPHIYLSEPSG